MLQMLQSEDPLCSLCSSSSLPPLHHSPLAPQSWRCNRGWGAGRCPPGAAWQSQSHRSWWSRGSPSHPCTGCCWVSGLGEPPVVNREKEFIEKGAGLSACTDDAPTGVFCLPLGSGGSQQSWWWCRAQRWPLSRRRTSAWGSYPAAPRPSSAPSPGTRTCPHHTPDEQQHTGTDKSPLMWLHKQTNKKGSIHSQR